VIEGARGGKPMSDIATIRQSDRVEARLLPYHRLLAGVPVRLAIQDEALDHAEHYARQPTTPTGIDE